MTITNYEKMKSVSAACYWVVIVLLVKKAMADGLHGNQFFMFENDNQTIGEWNGIFD